MKQATARLGTERENAERPRTRISTLRSDWPIMLRPVLPLDGGVIADWSSHDTAPARVHQAAAAAGPIGGDHQQLQIRVGPGSALILGEVSPTVLLPGPRGQESRIHIDITVGPGATLAWLPQLVIAARDCRHRTDIRIAMSSDSRLLLWEQSLFGRFGEQTGSLRQRVQVRINEYPLYDQELTVGPHTAHDCELAITGDQRSVGSVLVAGPGVEHSVASDDPDTAIMPLRGSGIVAAALAADTAALTRKLHAALTRILGNAPRADHTDANTRG